VKADSSLPTARIAPLPLALACAVAVGVTVYPQVFARAGHTDHIAALLAFCGMAAGFVRGVGFRPRRRWLAWLFSTPACLALIAWSTRLSLG